MEKPFSGFSLGNLGAHYVSQLSGTGCPRTSSPCERFFQAQKLARLKPKLFAL